MSLVDVIRSELLNKKTWDGVGLPPVGIECESKQFAQINWNKFRVVAVENGHIFGFWNEDVSVGLDSKMWEFRPIRSEVDKKRAKGVIALSRVDPHVAPFEYGDKYPDGSLVAPFYYELYDAIAAGKVPGIKLED